MPSESTWTKCWEEWSGKGDFQTDIQQHRQERQTLFRLMEESLHATGTLPVRVLEVGCGTAIDSHLLAQDPSYSIFALDRSLEAIQVARRISQYFRRSATLFVGDASVLPFPDGTFDVVFSQGLLEHFREPMPLLREQVRVLKPSGFLIVDVPQTFAGLGLYSLRKQWKIRRGTWPWGWETQFSYPQLRRMGASLGLVPLGVGGYGFDGLFNLLANPHVMIDKHPFLRRLPIAQAYKRFYLRYLRRHNDRLWGWLCRQLGHWFLICIVVRFQKGKPCASF